MKPVKCGAGRIAPRQLVGSPAGATIEFVRALLCVVALIALVASVPSEANPTKGPNLASVCGASGCRITRGDHAVLPLYDWWNRPFYARDAPRLAPYYRIRVSDGARTTHMLLYAPSRRAIRIWRNAIPEQIAIGPYWRSVPDDATTTMRSFIAGVEPFPAARGWRY